MKEIFMRTFTYSQEIQNLLTPEIVQLLTCIHEHIERTLSNLVKEGYIIKVGSGPATAYIRQH